MAGNAIVLCIMFGIYLLRERTMYAYNVDSWHLQLWLFRTCTDFHGTFGFYVGSYMKNRS